MANSFRRATYLPPNQGRMQGVPLQGQCCQGDAERQVAQLIQFTQVVSVWEQEETVLFAPNYSAVLTLQHPALLGQAA